MGNNRESQFLKRGAIRIVAKMELISGKDLFAPFRALQELQDMIKAEMVEAYYFRIRQMVAEETLPETDEEESLP